MSNDKAPKADYVQIVILDALVRRERFMNQAGPDARHFIRGDRCSDTAPAGGYSTFQVSASHRLGERNDKIRVVIILVRLPVAEFDHVITRFAQLSGKMLHEFKSAMVSRDTDALERFREPRHRRTVQAPSNSTRVLAGDHIAERF
jgi:hypothetical protein